jgi:hypothetical protein
LENGAGSSAARELLEADTLETVQAEVKAATIREALKRIYPNLELGGIADQASLDLPAAPLTSWSDVREEAERGLISPYLNRMEYSSQQLLAKAVTGKVAGSLEGAIALEAAARDVELDSSKVSELAKQLESRGFELVERQRRIEAARLQAVMSRVGSGLYDRFEYISRPSDAQHSKAGQDVAEVALWSGSGWVVQTALSLAEMPDYVQALEERRKLYRALMDELFTE